MEAKITKKSIFDGFQSALLKMGTFFDRINSFKYGAGQRLDDLTLENMYFNSAIFSKIIDKLPDEMTKLGIEINHDKSDLIVDELFRLNVFEKFNLALKYARLFGGSVIFIRLDDDDFSLPVNLKSINEIKELIVIDKRYINIPDYSPLKENEFYNITVLNILNKVHKSRIIKFDGIDCGNSKRWSNQGWGESIANRLYDSVRNYEIVTNGIPNIFTDFNQGIYKFKGLNELLSQDNDDLVASKLSMIDSTKSILKSLVLDSDDDYERKTTNTTGLDKLIESVERNLITCSNMPHTILLGESPGASLNQSGNSQKSDWYDYVKYNQEINMRRELQQLIDLIAIKLNIKDKVIFEFKSLYQLDDLETAKLRYQQAQTDILYLENQILSSEEIRNSRFGDGQYSLQTQLDDSTLESPDIVDLPELDYTNE